MTNVDLELLQGLPPEVLEQLMGLGSSSDKMGLEQQRMAMGQELGQPMSGQHTTAGGAMLGGMGDILRGAAGGFLQGQGMVNQRKLVDEQAAGRKAYAQSIQDFLRRRNQAPVGMGGGDAALLEPLV